MAIAKNGPQGYHVGRIDNIVYYILNGQNVSRKIGISTKPPTNGQLRTRLETKMCSEFCGRIQEFINVGFGIEMLGTTKNAFNLAVAYNKNNMFRGVYPDLEIAYDMLILSKGALLPAQNPLAEKTETGIKFSWDTDPLMPFPQATDQVMMLAYFPEEEKSIFTLFGSERLSGTATLQIPASLRDQHVETFVSFASADRKQLADSTYTGSFNK